MIFLDQVNVYLSSISIHSHLSLSQPVNVGYSYGKKKISTSKESARDVYAFLQLFLGQFPEYAANPFHISGESYGSYNECPDKNGSLISLL